MRTSTLRRTLAAGLVGTAILAPADVGASSGPPGHGPRGHVLALTEDGRLLRVRRTAPGTVLGSIALTGLAPGEMLLGIDLRPANGQIYGVTEDQRIVVIDARTGTAVPVSTLSTPLVGSAFGVDFNPVADRLRLVSDAGQNLRVDVNSGSASVDAPLAYALDDAQVGTTPHVAAAAYTASRAGATATALYDIDTGSDMLVRQDPPNDGTLRTVGPLGVDASDVAGFDLQGGRALAALTGPSSTMSRLYSIDLASGAADLLGVIGGGARIRDLTLLPGPPRAIFGLDGAGRLVRFAPSGPGTVVTTTISGLANDDELIGIDVRPATGQLIGVAGSGRIYRIAPLDGAVTLLSTMTVVPSGRRFGIDFNPTVDRLRIVSDTGQNLRVDVTTGATSVDEALVYAAGDPHQGSAPRVVAIAYSRNVHGATTTALFDIDARQDSLASQDPPNEGLLSTIGDLGRVTDGRVGFDIDADGRAWASLTGPGASASRLATVDRHAGSATAMGRIGGSWLLDLAVAPRGAFPVPGG